jgi:Protein of unknown function (DUF998)
MPSGRGTRSAHVASVLGTLPPAALWAFGVAAGLAYSGWVVDLAVAPEHDWHAVVSTLQVTGAGTATLLRLLDVVCGLLTLALVPAMSAALPGPAPRGPLLRRVAIGSTVAFAAGCIGAAVVPLPPCAVDARCRGVGPVAQQLVHDAFSIGSLAGVLVGAAAVGVITRHEERRWLSGAAWVTVVLGGGVATALFVLATAPVGPSWGPGIAQRFQILVTSLWLVALGALAAVGARQTRDSFPPETERKPSAG